MLLERNLKKCGLFLFAFLAFAFIGYADNQVVQKDQDQKLDATQAKSIGSARAKAFELWPTTNNAKPTVFSKSAPSYPSKGMPWKFNDGDKVNIKVDATKILHAVTPYQFGNNAAWWDQDACWEN